MVLNPFKIFLKIRLRHNIALKSTGGQSVCLKAYISSWSRFKKFNSLLNHSISKQSAISNST